MRLRRILFFCILTILPAGCTMHRPVVSSAPAATLKGDASHPDVTRGWVDTKLYFGLGPADDAQKGISEAAWRLSLNNSVSRKMQAIGLDMRTPKLSTPSK